jgi:hypothetical protein
MPVGVEQIDGHLAAGAVEFVLAQGNVSGIV